MQKHKNLFDKKKELGFVGFERLDNIGIELQ